MDTEHSLHQVTNNFERNAISIDNRYQYEIVQSQHIDGIVNLFTDAFCESEPMTHYLLLDHENYKIFTRTVTENAVKDGLSIVALDRGKVIACALVEDFAAAHQIPINFDPKFRYIVALLEQLGSKFFDKKEFNKNHIAHLFITAVDKQYRHQGLSTQVNFQAMNLAAKHGFEFIYCELTNIYNEMGILHHLKNHKRLIGTCIYDLFEVEGIKPFSHLEGAANSYLWEIRPGAKLNYKINNIAYTEEL